MLEVTAMRQTRNLGSGRKIVATAAAGVGDQTIESPGEEFPDSLSYYQQRERWETLGKRVATFRDEAKRAGVPMETLPGARSAIEAFKQAGAKLDRRAR
jgi:hypothetical protein